MEIKLASHEHSMYYHRFDDEKWCDKCSAKIHGAAYACLCCELWLHDSCAKALQHLPRQITHPLHHSHHHLVLDWSGVSRQFTCDLCLRISSGTNYGCSRCEFELDLACAFASTGDYHRATTTKTKRIGPNAADRDDKKMKIQHYCHIHPMIIYKYSDIVSEHDYDCSWCDKPLTGIFYGCKLCDFFLHEFCTELVPKTLNHHPFHPSHPLRLDFIKAVACNACTQEVGSVKYFYTASYVCKLCNFVLHFSCAKLVPTLKHDSHNHSLTYFGPTFRDPFLEYHFRCNSCLELCLETFYRCVQCDLNLHLKCVPVPPLVEHRYHRHPLSLNKPIREDEIGEYYCDVCEKERDPTHEVYYCEECTYIAHIECALDQPVETSTKQDSPSASISMDGEASELKEMEQIEPILFRLVLHQHPLKFCEVTENFKRRKHCICQGCLLEVTGPGYICEGCPYVLHENCAKLPDEVQHPLHPQHCLNLYSTPLGHIICDECQDFYTGFIYLCEKCDFKLDLKCATRAVPSTSRSKDRSEREAELFHFSHRHMLLFCNHVHDPGYERLCNMCRLQIFGPTYQCMKCGWILHESCVRLLQEIMQVPIHNPEHTLSLSYGRSYGGCHACGLKLLSSGYNYGCKDCAIDFHITCAMSLGRNALKRESSHVHRLYYFGTEFRRFFAMYQDFVDIYAGLFCSRCGETCSTGQSFYRCLECFINFHLECVPLPQIVKSKTHIHPLTLKDWFREDDSDEQYCDACEKQRHPTDHVYFCEECQGIFVAHIECALSKEEEVVSCLVPRERKRRMRKPRRSWRS